MATDGTTILLRMPAINGLKDLSEHLGLSPRLLHKLSSCPSLFYRRAEIPKKTGGVRVVFCPSKQLKAAQAWILRNILQNIQPEPAATAYLPHRNAKQNAEKHHGKRYLYCLDLSDFFPSIPYGHVHSVFMALGYSRSVAHLLTSLCTLDGILPQGAVTSPALSNLVCIRLDRRISRYVGARNVTYTRYADDITLSSNNPKSIDSCNRTLKTILADEGFSINAKKTRFMGPAIRQEITGFVLSSKGVTVGRRRKRGLRAAIYQLATQLTMKDDKRLKLTNHVVGWIGYLKHIDPDGYDQVHSYFKKFEPAILALAKAAASH